MRRILLSLFAATTCVCATAQETSFLPKAEMEDLASGKKWTQNFTDGRAVTWDLQKDGSAMTNYTMTVSKRVGTANGKWSVDDQGEMCLVWRGGYADRCVKVKRVEDQLRLVDSKNGSSVRLTVE